MKYFKTKFEILRSVYKYYLYTGIYWLIYEEVYIFDNPYSLQCV